MLKRVSDVLVAGVALLVLAPLSLLIALAIKLDSPGPVLFRQLRIGRYGKPFVLYKFRSMRESRQVEPAPSYEIADFQTYVFNPPGPDPRVTRVGMLLRATSLDELPQLYNVLKGDMSIVGPRPELPEIVEQYPPSYSRRHEVRPGITGLAQISGRADLTYHQIMLHDLAYLEKQSYWRDWAIMLRTVLVVLTARGAR